LLTLAVLEVELVASAETATAEAATAKSTAEASYSAANSTKSSDSAQTSLGRCPKRQVAELSGKRI
jgi:hypothetical protein